LCDQFLGQTVSRCANVDGVVRTGLGKAFPAIPDHQPHPARGQKVGVIPSNISDRIFDQFGDVFDADDAAPFADHEGHAGGQVPGTGPDVEASHALSYIEANFVRKSVPFMTAICHLFELQLNSLESFLVFF
jgi:hypothetical protein